jgi:hypothetical protein
MIEFRMPLPSSRTDWAEFRGATRRVNACLVSGSVVILRQGQTYLAGVANGDKWRIDEPHMQPVRPVNWTHWDVRGNP